MREVTEHAAARDEFGALKNQAHKTASSIFGRPLYAEAVQNDWQRLLDGLFNENVQLLKALSAKYRKDEGLDGMGSGTSGAGPCAPKQARRGAAQLARFAREGVRLLQFRSDQRSSKSDQ